MSETSEFLQCAKFKKESGTYTIECRKGLWSVTSKDKDAAMKEAMHYFTQYKRDGEYSDIIKTNVTVLDILRGEL